MKAKNNIQLAFMKKEQNMLYFYFLGVQTSDLFEILPKNLKFKKISLMASHLDNYIYDCDILISTVNDCYNFFKTNFNYTIDDFEAEFENNLYIEFHDNTEIHIKFPKQHSFLSIIKKLLRKYHFTPQTILNYLTENENKFLKIEAKDKILQIYQNFQDYKE